MTFSEAQHYLDSFINFEVRPLDNAHLLFRLDRVRELLRLMGSPQEGLKIIHVAGSKGKGSTCALTASILREAGYSVGFYTSPHLDTCRERIRILRTPADEKKTKEIFTDAIGEEEFCVTLQRLQPFFEKMRSSPQWGALTFFEMYTALALFYFFQKKVDWVVLETGLGGRLDATNAVSSLVCAFTSISLEHTQFLGNTLEAIAQEKAAIIKGPGQKVIAAIQPEGVRDVIRERCGAFSIRPRWVGEDIRFQVKERDAHGQRLDIDTPGGSYADLRLALAGGHQAVNAAVSIGIIESLRELGCRIAPEAVYAGLKNVFWPGRWEVAGNHPFIILDGAHNPDSALSLSKSLREVFAQRKVILILGMSEDKDREGICRAFHNIAHKIIMTKARHPRAHDFSRREREELFPQKPCFQAADIQEALTLARRHAGVEDVIVVSGSLFLVAEARACLVSP